MEISNQEKAAVLVQALPYIQNYYNKIIVVKYGGNAMVSEELTQAVISDIVLLSLVGIKVVLVHGGGPDITATMEKMGLKSRFVGGLRVTDKDTAEVVQMVLAGKTNKNLVKKIELGGGKAIGLCGLDGGMIQAEKMEGEGDLGFVGTIKKVDVSSIFLALDHGYIPVVSTIGYDEHGDTYNINADTAAAYLAGALGAEDLIMMTDIVGLLQDKEDDTTLIPEVQVSEVPYLIHQGIISGGMIPKVDSCVLAVRRGVRKAFIIDGRIPHAILIEMMTDEGIGTMFH